MYQEQLHRIQQKLAQAKATDKGLRSIRSQLTQVPPQPSHKRGGSPCL